AVQTGSPSGFGHAGVAASSGILPTGLSTGNRLASGETPRWSLPAPPCAWHSSGTPPEGRPILPSLPRPPASPHSGTRTNHRPQERTEKTMANETTLTLIGNLTADPELRFTKTGTAVADFTVASTPRSFRDGHWHDGDPLFLRCTIWREPAEH